MKGTKSILKIYKKAIKILTQDHRTKEDIVFLNKYIKNFKFFNELSESHGPRIFDNISRSLKLRIYEEGNVIVAQGERGDNFYIIISGLVGVWIILDNDEGLKELKEIKKLGKYEAFGEMALINSNNKRTATIIAIKQTHVGILSKTDFMKATGNEFICKTQEKLDFLSSFSLFEKWTNREITTLSYEFLREEVNKNQQIYIENQPSQYIYFIESGEFEMLKRNNYSKLKQQLSICLFSNKQIIGLESILNIDFYLTSVQCVSVNGVLHKISSQDLMIRFNDENYNLNIQKIANKQIKFIQQRIQDMNEFYQQREQTENNQIEAGVQQVRRGGSSSLVRISMDQTNQQSVNEVEQNIKNSESDTKVKNNVNIIQSIHNKWNQNINIQFSFRQKLNFKLLEQQKQNPKEFDMYGDKNLNLHFKDLRGVVKNNSQSRNSAFSYSNVNKTNEYMGETKKFLKSYLMKFDQNLKFSQAYGSIRNSKNKDNSSIYNSTKKKDQDITFSSLRSCSPLLNRFRRTKSANIDQKIYSQLKITSYQYKNINQI